MDRVNGDMEEVLDFHEELPNRCPPTEVEEPKVPLLWRLLCSADVDVKDFVSERQKYPERTFRDECAGASISLVPTFEQALAAVKTPLMKKKGFTHAVAVSYEKDAGVWHLDKPAHCHFWPYAGFNFSAVVGDVKELT